MIKFLGSSPDGPVIGLGLSKLNVERLQQGNPIDVDLSELKMPGHVVIFYGDTEDDMRQMMEETGLVGPDTPRINTGGAGSDKN